MLVFTHPGLAEGPYSKAVLCVDANCWEELTRAKDLTVGEFVWGGPLNSPTTYSHFDVPVEFSFDPKAREDEAAHEEL